MTISDIENRILSRLDRVYDKVDDLCDRMVRQETKLDNHLESQEKKFNKTTVIISTMVGIIGLVAILK